MLLLDIPSSMDSFLQLLSVLFIFVVVLALTYFTTRFLAGYQKTQMHQKNLRVVETLKITQNKYIQIIEVGTVYLVIAVCKDTVTRLAELTPDQLKELNLEDLEEKKTSTEDFQTILEKVKKRIPKK
ncbi:MAG: flagellar biosynthetic protein FliO [Lachnospiraceae bacterium]